MNIVIIDCNSLFLGTIFLETVAFSEKFIDVNTYSHFFNEIFYIVNVLQKQNNSTY